LGKNFERTYSAFKNLSKVEMKKVELLKNRFFLFKNGKMMNHNGVIW
jgi:hypothetical protein